MIYSMNCEDDVLYVIFFMSKMNTKNLIFASENTFI